MPKDDHIATSPFSTLLSSNIPPSEQDLVYLLSFVEDRGQQITALDKEIEGMESAFRARCARQAELRNAVRAHESLLHPIRRIPQHVLQEIFILCRPTHCHPAMDKREAPLLLTRVCRFWRDLAQRTPELWDCIHIPMPGFISEDVLLFQLGVATQWLDRAEERPLSISLWSSIPTSPTSKVENAVRSIILDRASRIRRLQLEVPQAFLKYLAGSLAPESWVSLEKIVVRGISDIVTMNVTKYEASHDLLIWKAPRLKSVTLEGVDDQLPQLPLQWDRMEEIVVEEAAFTRRSPLVLPRSAFTLRRAWDMLQMTPKLRSLKISLNGGDNADDEGGRPWLPTKAPLVLPHLIHLDLHDTIPDPTLPDTLLLPNLRLPALTSLWYELNQPRGQHPPPEHHPLLRFLHAQDRPILLHSFKIHELAITRSDLLECLKMAPSLQQLWVWHEYRGISDASDDPNRGAAVDEAFLLELRQMCPRLEALQIDRANVGFEGVKDFVVSRLSSPPSGEAYPARVSKILRLSIGLAWDAPEGGLYEGRGRGFRNSLEEDLWNLGVEAHITTFSRSSPSLFSNFNDEYDPRDGLHTINSMDAGWD